MTKAKGIKIFIKASEEANHSKGHRYIQPTADVAPCILIVNPMLVERYKGSNAVGVPVLLIDLSLFWLLRPSAP